MKNPKKLKLRSLLHPIPVEDKAYLLDGRENLRFYSTLL